MATTTKTFDAVLESRKWKEAVARETAGMTLEQRLAYFDREKALEAMRRDRERFRLPSAGSSS